MASSSNSAGISYLCEDPTTSAVNLSYHDFNKVHHPLPSFNRWKGSRIAGVVEIKNISIKDDTITVAAEKTVDNLATALNKELVSWRQLDNIEDPKEEWFLFITPFFVKTFRQVFKILIDIYQSDDYHGCICANCIRINEKGQVRLFLRDTTDRTLSRDLADLRNLMIEVIHAPFRELDDFCPLNYHLPADVAQLLKDLEQEWNIDLVKIGFLLDRPIFWNPAEKLLFFRKFDHLSNHLSNKNHGDIEWNRVFKKLEDYGCISEDWPERWIRPEEVIFQESLMLSDLDPKCPNPTHFASHAVAHFRRSNNTLNVSDPDILIRLISCHPQFFNLPTHLRRAVMDLSIESHDNDSQWVWCQMQLVSSEIAPDVRRMP